MQIKRPTEFEAFKDGECWICTVNAGTGKKATLRRFDNRVVGSKRYYIAAQAQREITRIIRIPMTDVDKSDMVLIGEKQYRIEQAQPLPEKNPPSTDLTLEEILRPYEVI